MTGFFSRSVDETGEEGVPLTLSSIAMMFDKISKPAKFQSETMIEYFDV